MSLFVGCFFLCFWYVVHFGIFWYWINLNKVVFWINLNKVAYWINSNKVVYRINSNKVAQVHEINSKITQFYLVLISSKLHYILPKYAVTVEFKFYCWMRKKLGLKCLILSVKICSALWKLKRMDITHVAFYLMSCTNSSIKFLHIRWVGT